MITPKCVNFGRRIIIQDKWLGSKKTISFHNPDRNPINWHIDVDELQKPENKCFTIETTQGTVPSG